MVGFRVKHYWFSIGNGSFLHSFFSTVCVNLEHGKWGSKYPYIMKELYRGELTADHVDAALKELRDIEKKLKKYPPSKVVWDIEDLTAQPPWGDNISPDITDLSNYFVTSDGEDFIGVFREALEGAKLLEQPLLIKSL